MANYKAVAARWARHYGIPPKLFATLVQWESGWNNGAVSPRGAKGFTQLEPGTAEGLGVNPDDPGQNLRGGAHYLREQYDAFKGLAARIHVDPWALALAAYNAGPNAVKSHGGIPPYAETQKYVHGILSAAGHLAAVASLAPKAPKAPKAATATALVPRPPAAVAAPAAPQLPAIPDLTGVAFDNLSHIASHTYSPVQALSALTQDVAEQEHAAAAAPQPAAPSSSPTASTPTLPKTPMKPPALKPDDWKKWVMLAKGADRAGVSTSAAVLRFVAKIARAYGSPLTIGTGTNHNQYVIDTHRESDHWTGHAGDVPASGDELKRLGYLALVAAGMNPKDARAAEATGGLFNVGRYQIIFDSMIGGNHYNHLHVGVR